jgi:hypothetical protein
LRIVKVLGEAGGDGDGDTEVGIFGKRRLPAGIGVLDVKLHKEMARHNQEKYQSTLTPDPVLV